MVLDSAPTERRRRTVLLLILLVAFALRAGWALSRPADEAFIDQLPDQREYLTLATNLRHGNGLQFYDQRFRATVHAFRTPLYPAFVAGCGARVRIVQLVQAAVETSTVLAVYLLARALLSSDAARGPAPLFAACLVALNPFLVYFSALVLSETFFTALLAWGMLLLVVGVRRARLRADDLPADGEPNRTRPMLGTLLWLAGGLTLALSALVRPSAAPLAVVMGYGAAFLALNRTPAGAYQAVRHPAARRGWPLPVGSTMLLLTLLALLPWAWRNHRVVGSWVWTTTNGGVTLYDGFNPDATGASDQSFLRAMPQLRTMNEVGRSQYLEAKAKEYIRERPVRALQLAGTKVARTWSPVPLSREYGQWKHRLVGLLYGVPFFLLVIVGLASPNLSRPAKVFLLLPAIYITAVHALSVGSLRYRVPVEPPMAVVAAAAIHRSRLAWRRAGENGNRVPNDGGAPSSPLARDTGRAR